MPVITVQPAQALQDPTLISVHLVTCVLRVLPTLSSTYTLLTALAELTNTKIDSHLASTVRSVTTAYLVQLLP
jgi:hypothetical protein